MGENNSLDWENLWQTAETERLTISLQEAEIETARIQSLLEDAQKNTKNCWSYAAVVSLMRKEFHEWRLLQLSNRSYCVGQ